MKPGKPRGTGGGKMARIHSHERQWVGALLLVGFWALAVAAPVEANPYLTKPGETRTAVKIGTCAVTGGFIHLYAAVENSLFEKYGLKAEHVFNRGSSISLAALASGENQFLYCAADATIPGMATGLDIKLVAAPLVGLPYVLITRKDIRTIEDLKGKALAVTRPGDLTYRLTKALLKKFNFGPDDVKMRPVGGSQPEQYQAMVADIVQGTVIVPPLDVRARHDGFNVIYHLNDLDLPFIYSSVHTNSQMLKEHPGIVQKVVAAMAESLYFVEKNPDKAKAALAKVLKLDDSEALQSAYNAFTKDLVNRRLTIPANAVAETVEVARENGTDVKRKPAELFENSFAENLEKSGFLKELWGGEIPGKKK